MNLSISELSLIDNTPKIQQYLESMTDYISESYDFNINTLSDASNSILESSTSENNIKNTLSIINTIIDKYISYLKKITDNFVKEYKNIKISDKLDTNVLSNLKTNYTYIFNGYTFTIDKLIPNVLPIPNQHIFSDFYNSVKSLKNEDDLSNIIDNYLSEMTKCIAKGYNKFRGEMLNSKSNIDIKSFSEYCFMAFRDNKSDVSKLTLGYKDIKNIFNRNYNDISDSIIYSRDRIIDELNRIKTDANQFNELLKFDIIKTLKLDSENNDINKKLFTIIKLRISQIADISSIYTIVISDKINAACKMKVQDSKILTSVSSDANINESYYTDDVTKIIDEAVYDTECSNNISNILEMHQLLNKEDE